MTDKRTLGWIYGFSAVFIAANAVALWLEFYWLNLLPAFLLVMMLAFFALDKLLLLCTFLTPLSINLADRDVQLGLSLPVEPILAGVLVLYFIRLLHEGRIDSRIMRHPVTLALMVNLGWILITCFTSTMPVVSFKFFISRLWFVIPFYFLGVEMFRNFSNTKRFIWLYVLPLTGVIFYTLYWHAQFNFGEDPAHWVMSPFYNDHTAYGAVLAMFFPPLIGLAANKKYNINVRIILMMLLVIFTVALIFSYTRAAWLSLILALVFYVILMLRIRFKTVFGILLIAGFYLWVSWGDLMMKLEQNRQDTSNDLAEHVQSISNISTDASNLERLNRWNSAFRMFQEKPVFGWGPGTYSFQYAPFQLSSEKTIISTNAGDMGNAHSEYIGPLCESGVFGMLSFVAVVFAILLTGWRVCLRLKKSEQRMMAIVALLGITTYFIHGALNNFLDTDKASIPFWGFAAIIVAIDLFHTPKEETEEKKAA